MDEAQWLSFSAQLRTRPLMPDCNVRATSQEDRRAVYRFIKSLGPGGQPSPAYLPPGHTSPLPYFTLLLPAEPTAPAPPAATAITATPVPTGAR